MGYIPIPFQKPRKKRVRNMNPAPQPRRVYRDEPITDPEDTMGPPCVNSPENLRLWARQQAAVDAASRRGRSIDEGRARRERFEETPLGKMFKWVPKFRG